MHDPRNIDSEYSKYFINQIDYNVKKGIYQFIKEGLHAIYSLEAKKKINRLISDAKPDAVFLHDIYHHLSPSILHAFRKYDLPVVWHLSDFFLICPSYRLLSKGRICEKCKGGKFYHAVLERCFRNSLTRSGAASLVGYLHHLSGIYEKNIDHFIAPSMFVMNKHQEMGFNGSKIVHIPQGISIDTIKPKFQHNDYILYFGVIEKWKGVGTLIKAMKSLPNTKLIIAGDGSERSNLELLVSREKINNVKFVGYKVGDELWKVVEGAAFVIVPSEWYEVYGMVTYESFAHGKAVIGSNIGGTPELIEEGQTGLLFEPGNIEELTSQIGYLFNNKDQIIYMGKKAREKVEKDINPDINCERIITLLKS